MKNGQISTEYMILVGFITFVVISITGIALFYTAGSRDKVLFSNIDSFSSAITSTAESVYYSGQPSLATITPYLPSRVLSIDVEDYEIVFNIETSTGNSRIAYTSKVKLAGSLSSGEGIHRIRLEARDSDVLISEV